MFFPGQLSFPEGSDHDPAVRKAGLPVIKSVCPVDGATNREKTKEFLREREREDPGFTYRLFGALRRSGLDGWGFTGRSSPRRDKREE